jgi:hypothetical protein
MDASMWNGFVVGLIGTIVGVVGLALRWSPVWGAIVLLVLGVPSVIFCGMPIWRALFSWVHHPKHL